MSRPTVLYFGASRGVAFAAYTSLAAKRPDLHHILLIRSPSRFKESEEYKSLPADVIERSTYFQGDAHSEENIAEVLKVAGPDLHGVVSSIGFTPPSDLAGTWNVLVHGMTPPDLCCRALFILISELAKVYPTLTTKPKFVLCSSMGMGKVPHQALAFGLGPFYTIALTPPHVDKIGMELIMEHAILPSTDASLPRLFPDFSEVPSHVLTADKFATLPPPFIPPTDVLVLRPALLHDGVPKGWSTTVVLPEDGAKTKVKGDDGYRVIQEGLGPLESKGKSCYSVSRKDVGDFIAIMLSGGKDKEGSEVWWGRQPVLAY
ncbi:hypothetical protein DL93DRAFT_2074552 [Clavulina sp. PMI_390]|nr:hypothetical protein DL93DRAFT_2074552 [Clavulina sp. PMI_390]